MSAMLNSDNMTCPEFSGTPSQLMWSRQQAVLINQFLMSICAITARLAVGFLFIFFFLSTRTISTDKLSLACHLPFWFVVFALALRKMFKERIAEVFQFNLALHNESNLNWKYEFPWKGEILTVINCALEQPV